MTCRDICFFCSLFLMSIITVFPVFAKGVQDSQMGKKSPVTMTERYTGMELVLVEGGCYQMGCGEWQINCRVNEKPAHEVCVDGFWMGKYEVTQGQWLKVMGNNPSDYQGGERYPVETVSWDEVQLFIQKLNNLYPQHEIVASLPTEAEWEYAARSGGKNEIYPGGDSVDKYWHEFAVGHPTFPVGHKKANGYELYDMSGNVYEWCSDWYSDTYYEGSPVKNPGGPSDGSKKSIRSSTQPPPLEAMRTTYRYGIKPDFKAYDLGFRLKILETSSRTPLNSAHR